MKRFTVLAVVLALAVVFAYSGSSALHSQEGKQGGAAADRTPPGIKKGVKVRVDFLGSNPETVEVQETRGNWVRVTWEGKEYWLNFDNVTWLSFPK